MAAMAVMAVILIPGTTAQTTVFPGLRKPTKDTATKNSLPQNNVCHVGLCSRDYLLNLSIVRVAASSQFAVTVPDGLTSMRVVL